MQLETCWRATKTPGNMSCRASKVKQAVKVQTAKHIAGTLLDSRRSTLPPRAGCDGIRVHELFN